LKASFDDRKRRSLRGAWVVILVLLLRRGSDGLFPSAERGSEPGGPARHHPTRPTPVVAATAQTGDINVYLAGSVPSRAQTVTVRSRVDGELLKICSERDRW